MVQLGDLSTPISSITSSLNPPLDEGSVSYLFQCLNCGVSVEMSSSWVNPNGDLLSVNREFVKNPQIEELPLPYLILCSTCHQQLKKKKKSNSDALQVQVQGQHQQAQGQAEKVVVNVTTGDDGDYLRNPFEIDKIVEIILKYMKMIGLLNSRLINKMWNKVAVKVLSTPSTQAKIYPKQCTKVKKVDDLYTTRYIISFQDTVEILKNSEDSRKIFRKFEFGYRYHENSLELEFDDSTYPQIFEIIDLTQPTHVTFMSDTYSPKNLDINLFTIFLHKISHHIAHLKIRLNVCGKEFLIEEAQLPVQFPHLKSLKIEAISQETIQFMKNLLKKCVFLDDLKLHGHELILYSSIDKFIPDLLTSKVAENLVKLHLSETSFEFMDNLEPIVLAQMNLKSLIVESSEILSEFENQDPFLKFRQLNRFLTSQAGSLEEFTIHFNLYIYNENIYDNIYGQSYSLAPPRPSQMADQLALALPRLEKLTTFKLLYDWAVLPRKHDIYPNVLKKVRWPAKVHAINLPELLPNLKKIEISYDFGWKLSFMADKPCETVEELVVEKYSKGSLELCDLVCLFPNVKYLKMEFRDYGVIGEMQANFNSLKGWSSTLKKIEIKFYQSFPENFNFRGISSLSNLDHLYLQQLTKTQDQNEIHLNFTPLFNMEKLSKLVIQNIKISEEVIEALFKKFPNLDYTF